MKVGIVMPIASVSGGAEFMLLHLLRANQRVERVDYAIMLLESGPLREQIESLGYPVSVCEAGKLRQIGRYASTVWRLRRWMKREKLTSVLSWMSKAHLYAGPAAHWAGIKAIWFQHGIPDRGSKMDALLRLIPAAAVFCPSEAARTAQREATPRLPAVVVHPGVDLERFDPEAALSGEAARRLLQLPEEGPIIGVIARLQTWKGVHVFIQAAARIAEARPDATFVVVGGSHFSEPEYPETLRRLSERLGLRHRIRFAGQQAETTSWIQAFDVLVHCSVGMEPFGMVIIEGMALGKAVIASKRGGPLEIITDGKDGLLVTPGRSDELASAVLRLLADRAYREQLRQAGMERAKAFSTERMSLRIARYIRQLSS